MKLLFLLTSLKNLVHKQHAIRLARYLAKQKIAVHICSLEEDAQAARELRELGCPVHRLATSCMAFPFTIWALRKLLVAFQPDAIHVFGAPAARMLTAGGASWMRRAIVSGVPITNRLGALERWVLSRAHIVAIDGPIEGDSSALTKLANAATIAPGVDVDSGESGARTESTNHFPRVVCLGDSDSKWAFRDAIWAMDIVTHNFPNTRLCLVGAARHRGYLTDFASSMSHPTPIEFVSADAPLSGTLAGATLCWLPHRTAVSAPLVLEAMAAGCSVLAYDTPSVRCFMPEHSRGLLVAPGDMIALARHSYTLLEDNASRLECAEAGRAHVQRHFPCGPFCEKYEQAYRHIAA